MRALWPLLLVATLAGCTFPFGGDEAVTPAAVAPEDAPPADEAGTAPAPQPPTPVDVAAGQLPPVDGAPSSPPPPAPPGLVLHSWRGRNLTETAGPLFPATSGVGDRPCTESACERVRLTVPEAAAGRHLEVVLRWPRGPAFGAWLEDEDGRILAWSANATVGAQLRVPDVQPGAYSVVVVKRVAGNATYEAAARLAHPSGQGELLPDLVTLAPTDLRIDAPDVDPSQLPGSPAQASALTGARGCSTLERAASGAVRCLRFSNGVANVGAGPLEIVLTPESGAGSASGQGRFTQRVFRADGTWRETQAGPAEFHAAHGHWHNAAANAYAVYRYDEASGARGDPVGAGKKGGICFVDIGVAALDLPDVWAPKYDGLPCLAPAERQAWFMGIQPGWYDMYPWSLEDQFVELGSASDGSYLLCATVNQDLALAESDAGNNEACTPFRLVGDAVTELSPRPPHAWG